MLLVGLVVHDKCYGFWVRVDVSRIRYIYCEFFLQTIMLTYLYNLLPKNTIEMIKASECPGSHALMDIQLRPLQTETLMILWFISASLWGCPGGGFDKCSDYQLELFLND